MQSDDSWTHVSFELRTQAMTAKSPLAMLRLAAALGVLALACTESAPPPPPSSASEMARLANPVEIALEPYVGRLVTMQASLDERPLTLLFDTGGGATLLSPDVVAQAGCVPEGRSVGFRMSGERVEWPLCDALDLELEEMRVTGLAVGVWDVMTVLPKDLPHLDGVASLETFRDRPVTIDLAHRRLTIETDVSLHERIAEATPVPARVATGLDGSALQILLEATVVESGATGWFMADSGNLAEVQLAPHMGSGAATPTEVTIALGEDVSVRAKAQDGDILYDGVLSEEVLRKIVLTLDLRDGRAWVEAAGPPPDR